MAGRFRGDVVFAVKCEIILKALGPFTSIIIARKMFKASFKKTVLLVQLGGWPWEAPAGAGGLPLLHTSPDSSTRGHIESPCGTDPPPPHLGRLNLSPPICK